LFIPGWACIGASLNFGNILARKQLAALMVKADQVTEIASQVNDLYEDQRTFFLYALMLFTVWLVVYLLAWVFGVDFQQETTK
jgi:hypothetical protein